MSLNRRGTTRTSGLWHAVSSGVWKRFKNDGKWLFFFLPSAHSRATPAEDERWGDFTDIFLLFSYNLSFLVFSRDFSLLNTLGPVDVKLKKPLFVTPCALKSTCWPTRRCTRRRNGRSRSRKCKLAPNYTQKTVEFHQYPHSVLMVCKRRVYNEFLVLHDLMISSASL